MSLRTRIAALVALVAAVATALVVAFALSATRTQLYAALDQRLDQVAQPRAALPGGRLVRRDLRDTDATAQVVDAQGAVRVVVGTTPITLDPETLAATLGDGVDRHITTTVGDEPVRAVVRPVGAEVVLVVAVPTASERGVLSALAWRLAAVGAVVVASATLAAWFGANAVVAPLRRLTAAAETIAATGDPAVVVATSAPDEAGRLSRAIDHMLGSLAAARDAQRRLVQDAGHELRTPIASIRANAELIAEYPDIPVATRARAAEDIVAEADELTRLVVGLVDLAGPADAAEPVVEIEANDLVVDALRALPPDQAARVRIAGAGLMLGRPGQVRRAVLNLLTNAVKYDPSGEPVDVTITAVPARPGVGPLLRLCVTDRGPGIAEADLAHATERFWRAPTARGLPGSGLGLAIVADVATRNGGVLTLGPADPGADPPGLTACLDLPAPARDVGA